MRSSYTYYHRVFRESNSKICLNSTVASKFARFQSSWLQRVGILREKVDKTHINDLDPSTTPLTNDMIQLGPLCSQSLFQFVQISSEYFEHLLLQYSSRIQYNNVNNSHYVIQNSSSFKSAGFGINGRTLLHNANLYPILHCFQVIANYWSNIRLWQMISLSSTQSFGVNM